MNRRNFLGTMAATALAAHSGWGRDSRPHRIETLGLQAYPIMALLQRNFEDTLSKVAAIGYREIELWEGYSGRSPQETRAILERCNLTSPSVHVGYKSLSENLPQLLETCQTVGHSYLVNPWIDDEIRNKPDGYKKAAETFNQAGETCQKAGIQFAYHNHFHEFIPRDGKLPYDVLLENCDRTLVRMELDLCWMIVGRQDPVAYFARYPGRFPLVHIRDIKKIPTQAELDSGSLTFDRLDVDVTEAGKGMIDWKRILSHSKQAGIKHYYVEQDKPADPLKSVAICYDYLRRLRF